MYSKETTELQVPIKGDLENLLALQATREIVVHGKPIIVDAEQVKVYLENNNVIDEEHLAQIIETQISVEDAEKIYNQQLHRRLVGQEFKVSEVGELQALESEALTLVVPKVELQVEIIEKAIESIAQDDTSKYITYLPPQTEEEKLNPIRCVTGNTLRTFLNDMQTEEGGLNMNSQILVYAKLLTLMPDDDPTKKYGLMQMRALMQYGDVVSNKNMRLALTELIDGEV